MSGKGISILFDKSYREICKVFIIIIQFTIISTPGILAVYLYNEYIKSLPIYINCIGTLVVSSVLFYIVYSIVFKFNSKKHKGKNDYEIFLSVLNNTIYIFLILIVLVAICILLFKKEIKEYFTSILVLRVIFISIPVLNVIFISIPVLNVIFISIPVLNVILLCILYSQNKKIRDCEEMLQLYSDEILTIKNIIEQK